MDETREQLLRAKERIRQGEQIVPTLQQVAHQVELRAKLLRILFMELQKEGFSSEEALTITAGQSI